MDFILVGEQTATGPTEPWAVAPDDLSGLDWPVLTVIQRELGTATAPRTWTLKERFLAVLAAFQDVHAGFFL